MIGKEQFLDLMNQYNEFEEWCNKVEELFPNFFESQGATSFYCLFETTIKLLFTEESQDWINAYMYENCRKWWDADKVEHSIEDESDLWELIKDYQK